MYFYFTLKYLFILKISKFLSWLFVQVGEQYDYNGKVILKLILQLEKQQLTIVIHISHNISQSKGNQAINFGQLIAVNSIIFLYTKSGEETSPRLFPKKIKIELISGSIV